MLTAHDLSLFKPRLLRHRSIIPGERFVLILPRKAGALVQQGRSYQPLGIVRHLVARLAGAARQLRWKLVEERHLVRRTRVHEEVEGVHPLPPPGRRAVEHAHPVGHRHRHDLVGELGEQRREAEQERLPAGGPLGADDEVPLIEEHLDHGGVAGAVAGEADGLYRGEELGEAGDGVGDGGDGAAEGGGEEDGVEEGAVGADEEDTGAGEGLLGRWRGDAAYGDADAEGPEGMVDEAHGEEGAGGNAEAGEEEADGDPEDDEQGEERRRLLDKPAVMEDDGLRQLVRCHGLPVRLSWHHVAFL